MPHSRNRDEHLSPKCCCKSSNFCYLILKIVKTILFRLESTVLELNREKDVLMREKEDVSSLLARRNDDLDRLTTELKALTDQLLHANKEKSEVMIKSEELNGKQLALDYK